MTITIQEQKEAILKKYKDQVPVPVVNIAKDLNLDIYELDNLADNQAGSIFPDENGRFIIYVNAKHNPARKRFTIAHEIAHYLLHRDKIAHAEHFDGVRQPVNAPSLLREDGRTDMTAEDKKMESEANSLAAEMLMPTQEFKKIWEMASSIEEVAKRFNVSVSAALVRAKYLCGETMI